MPRLAHMDSYRAPERRRLGKPRRTPAVARPRLWWIALGALTLLALPLAVARAQGLRSGAASVTVMATRLPDDMLATSPSVRELTLELPEAALAPGVLRLARPTLSTAVLYVRGVSGRFERVSETGVAVPAGLLQLRALRPGGGELPPASWEVELEQMDPATGERSRVRRQVATR